MLINLIVASISQCIHILEHHILYLKYIVLFVNYTSINLRGRENLDSVLLLFSLPVFSLCQDASGPANLNFTIARPSLTVSPFILSSVFPFILLAYAIHSNPNVCFPWRNVGEK